MYLKKWQISKGPLLYARTMFVVSVNILPPKASDEGDPGEQLWKWRILENITSTDSSHMTVIT